MIKCLSESRQKELVTKSSAKFRGRWKLQNSFSCESPCAQNIPNHLNKNQEESRLVTIWDEKFQRIPARDLVFQSLKFDENPNCLAQLDQGPAPRSKDLSPKQPGRWTWHFSSQARPSPLTCAGSFNFNNNNNNNNNNNKECLKLESVQYILYL